MKQDQIKRLLALLLALAIYLPSTLIGGAAGSWADDDGFYGDLDSNGAVNASDALLCLQASVQLITLTDEQATAADVDANGIVNAVDALWMLQMSVGLISSFPAKDWPPQPVPSDVQTGSDGTEDTISPDISSLIQDTSPSPDSAESTPAVSSEAEPPTVESYSPVTPDPSQSSSTGTESEIASSTSSAGTSSEVSFFNPSTATSVPSSTVSDSSASSSQPNEMTLSDFGYTAIDPEEYYCYAQLTAIQRSIYHTMHSNALSMTRGKFAVGATNEVTYADVRLAFLAYTNDHPEVFWLSHGYLYGASSTTAYIYFSDGGEQVDYLYSKASRDQMQAELLEAVTDAFRQCLEPNLTPFERELRLHDWLAEHCEYNHYAASNPDVYPAAFTSYGALVQGNAVCEGYSRAFQLLCYYAGIQCTLVTGVGDGGPHMWNAAWLDGWYLIDTTWDSSTPAIHTFFNLTSENFGLTHTPYPSYDQMTTEELLASSGFNFSLPQCDQITYAYHPLYGIYTSSQRADVELSAGILQRLQAGEDRIEIMVKDMVFQTAQEASDFLLPYLNDALTRLENDRYPQRYSYSIIPGTNCAVVTFVY